MWGMNLTISRQHKQQLVDWAEKAHPEECCGLLLGQGNAVHDISLARNVSVAPLCTFEIDPAILVQAEKAARAGGSQVVGYFHSHPNGVCEPSARDAVQANLDGRFWVIVAGTEISVWRAIENGSYFECFEPVELQISDRGFEC
jgi:desampylase